MRLRVIFISFMLLSGIIFTVNGMEDGSYISFIVAFSCIGTAVNEMKDLK